MQKRKSIEQKLVEMVFEITLAALILITSVTCVGILRVRRDTINSMKGLWEEASRSTRENMRSDALFRLQEQARYIGEQCDNNFRQMEYYAKQIASVAKDSGVWLPLEGLDISKSSVGRSFQYALPEGMSLDYFLPEMDRMGMVFSLINNIIAVDPRVSSALYTSKTGLTVFFDPKLGISSPAVIDFREQGWYKAATNGYTGWSERFEEPFGGGNTIAYTSPTFLEAGAELEGVASVFMLIDEMPDVAKEVQISGVQGQAVLMDKNGSIVSDVVRNFQKLLPESLPVEYANITHRIASGETGVASLELETGVVLIAYHPLQTMPFSVCVVVDQNAVVVPTNGAMEAISNFSLASSQTFNHAVVVLLLLLLSLLGATILATVIVGIHLAKRVTRPIFDLMDGVRQISQGNLEYRLDIRTGDEIEDFAEAFNLMAIRVGDYISTLSTAAANEERSATEMNVARQIQHSILPDDNHYFATRSEVTVVSWSEPAKEVGGDYYDYFFINDTHIAVIMADTSGKGVPAALFMVIARTLFRDNARPWSSPAEVLMDINQKLCVNNTTGMFVTAFMGILDLETGLLCYANAGHTPPMIYRKDEDFQWLHMHKSLFLAGMEDTVYQNEEVLLGPGDMIMLYTDGVTEAKNETGQFYTKNRLAQLMNKDNMRFLSPDEMLRNLADDLREFAGNAQQADDISMLILKYLGKEASSCS